MSPLRGSVEMLGALVSPRLHRGLHDHARYAGFSMVTPGVQPKIWDMHSPWGEGGQLKVGRGLSVGMWHCAVCSC